MDKNRIFFGVIAHRWGQLCNQNNYPNGGHKPRNHRVGDITVVFSDPHKTQANLKKSRQKKDRQDGREGLCCIAVKLSNHIGNKHHTDGRHGGGRPRNLGRSPPKKSSKEADKNGSIKPCCWAQTRTDTKGEGQGEGDNPCGKPTKKVSSKMRKIKRKKGFHS